MLLSKNQKDIYLKAPTAVTIGTFDGVHIGHRKIIKQLRSIAKQQGLKSTVLTFFPHPRMVLQQDVGLKLIYTIDERISILSRLGIDNLIVYPFTREFSRLYPQEYVEGILLKKLKARRVVVGYDHHFGRNRSADIKDLRKFSAMHNFEVDEISKQDIENVSVSSTKIRKALEKGDLLTANKYLTIPYFMTGKVILGKQLGRKLGYPTANLSIKEDYKLIPRSGVYVVKSTIHNRVLYGMMNIGTNPTVGGRTQTIETYFFDFDGDLYGEEIRIEMLQRIRSEKKFDSVEKLIEAMKEDEAFSRDFIKTHQNL